MSDTLAELAAKTGLGKPATDKQIASFVKKIGFQPPADYLDYLRLTNGNDPKKTFTDNERPGFPYTFHSLKDALAYTADYQFNDSGPLVIIGTDGGGNAFCLDGRYQPPRIIRTEYGDRGGTDNSVDFGTSFTAFLSAILRAPEDNVWPAGLPPFSSADGIVRKFPVDTDWSYPIDPVHYPKLIASERVAPLGFSPDGTIMVGWYLPRQPMEEGQPRRVELGFFRYPGGTLVRSVPFPPNTSRMAALTPDLFVLERSWTLLNIAQLELGAALKLPANADFGCGSLASGKVVLCTSPTASLVSDPKDGPFDIRLVDLETGGEIRRFQAASTCFAVQRGMVIQNNQRDGRLWMEDVESGKLLWETSLPPMANPYYHFLFSPDARSVLVHEVEGKIYAFRTADGKKLFRSKMDFDMYYVWAWMPDSRHWLATRNNGRQICLFDAGTGDLLVKCPHTAQRADLFPHPGGRDVFFHYHEGLHVWTLPQLTPAAANAAP